MISEIPLKFALGPDFLPLLFDNEFYLFPIYFDETDISLCCLLTEKQNIYAHFPSIQCHLGGG